MDNIYRLPKKSSPITKPEKTSFLSFLILRGFAPRADLRSLLPPYLARKRADATWVSLNQLSNSFKVKVEK